MTVDITQEFSPTRKRIYFAIKNCPGIHFRELQRRTAVGTGTLEHHLRKLEQLSLISSEKIESSRRFYPVGLTAYEKRVLGLLRQKTIRRIVLFTLEHSFVRHKQIMQLLDLSASSVSWYLRRLVQEEVFLQQKEGSYVIRDADVVVKLLVAYKESFVDSLVDRFVRAWEL